MRSLTLFASLVLAMSSAAHASMIAPPTAQGHGEAVACDAARLSSWFERQRQLTDGNVDPGASSGVPKECVPTAPHGPAMSEAGTDAPARHAARTATVDAEPLPGGE